MIVSVTLVDLARDPQAPARARGLVDRFDCDLGPERRADALLAVSELVTDAYFHGEGRIRLRIESTGPGLRAEVESVGGGARRDGKGDVRFHVVRRVSDSSGVDSAGAMTWFEIGTNGHGTGPLPAVQATNGDSAAPVPV